MKKNNDYLVVAETFYSIQGEGRYSGYPAVFLRLAGCNLLCQSSKWRCDTIEVWRRGRHIAFADVLSQNEINEIKRGAHLVVTGGEPLLQQVALVEYLEWLFKEGVCPFVEVETNGTILPDARLMKRVAHWNVSFKLSNSGEDYDSRVNAVALRHFNDTQNCDFKIVISCEADIMELMQDFSIIKRKKLILMPAGATQEELDLVRPIVVDACKISGIRYCDRLHIVTWNLKTGV